MSKTLIKNNLGKVFWIPGTKPKKFELIDILEDEELIILKIEGSNALPQVTDISEISKYIWDIEDL